MNLPEKCCNICGKKIITSGKKREDSLVIEKQWGYFSQKDGEKHSIVMCEPCYDQWVKTFAIPPCVEEMTELL